MVGTPPYPGSFLVRASGPNGSTIVELDVRQSVRPLAAGHQAAWFTYDADNRTVVNNGQLADNGILATADAGSYVNVYDAAGNVMQQLTLHGDGHVYGQAFSFDARNEETAVHYAVRLGSADQGVQDSYTYDAAGHQLTDTGYYALGQSGNSDGSLNHTQTQLGYDADGHLQRQASTTYVPATTRYVPDAATVGGVQPMMLPIGGGGTGGGVVTIPAHWETAAETDDTGYDHEGNVTAYSYHQYAVQGQGGFDASYTVSYLKKEGYLEQATGATTTTQYYQPATDSSYYDRYGNRVRVTQELTHSDGSGYAVQRLFQDDMQGQILSRLDGSIHVAYTSAGDWADTGYGAFRKGYGGWQSSATFTPDGGAATHHYAHAGGQLIGDFDEAGGINVKDQLTAFSSGASSAGYTVQAGDTLESIAQTVYGTSDLWYVIADANGLQGDSDLAAGQVLTLPSVTTHANSAGTFKPYDPGKVVGSTTPSLPFVPPPPSSSGCNPIAEIVVIVVVIIATIYTAGAAAEGFAGAGAGAGAGGAAAGGAAAGGAAAGGAAAAGTAAAASTTFATGASVLAGSGAGLGLTTGEILASAAIGGAVGNAAGQLVGNALGVSHGFSFGQMLSAGLGAGLTAGVGGAISAEGGDFSILANSRGGLEPAGAALFGAGASGSSVLAAKVTGQPEHFSWAGLAAAAVASGVTSAAGLKGEPLQRIGAATDSSFAENVAGGLLSGGLDRETSQLLGDNHVPGWEQIGEDAFGNALGNAAVGAIRDAAWKQVQPGMQQAAGGFVESVLNGTDSANNGWANAPIDMSHVNPQAALELQEEMAAEDMASIGNVPGSDGLAQGSPTDVTTLPNVWLSDGNTSLSAADLARLATSTTYSGTYVDPYLIHRNGGQADWSNTVQTFSLPDEVPAVATPLDTGAFPPSGASQTLLGQIDAQIHGFNGIVKDGLVDDGARYLHDGNQAAFVFTGLKYAFYQTFMPDSVEQAAISIVGGKVVGAGVGYLAKGAVAVAPVLGRDVGELAGSAGKFLDNLRSPAVVPDTLEAPVTPEDVPNAEVPNTAVASDAAAEVHPDILAAQQDQINSGYNPDLWAMTTVPKGSLVYGGLPGQSAYYTTEQTLLDGSFDSATIFDSLQVAPHPEFGYRPEMGVYQVLEDAQVPTGQALANSQIGTGGAQQYFFGNYGQQLQLVGRIPLGK